MRKPKLRRKHRIFSKPIGFIPTKALLRYYAYYNPLNREY